MIKQAIVYKEYTMIWLHTVHKTSKIKLNQYNNLKFVSK